MTARVAGIAGVVALLAGCGGAPAAAPPAAVDPEWPVFQPAGPEQPERPRGRWLTARVLAPVTLRAAPGGRRLERLRPRTEFGSPKVLSVLRRRGAWLQVLAPERPNHRPAWIRASRARLGAVDVSIHVDRSRRVLVVRRGGRTVRRMPVAVGRPGTPTPAGRFAVTDKLRTGRPDSPYGCCALALSGHQTKLLPGWPGGDRLAIHATPQPETIGRAASLGCMRAPTRDIRAMMRGVPLGAPVFVRA
jgi:hypothetical protein